MKTPPRHDLPNKTLTVKTWIQNGAAKKLRQHHHISIENAAHQLGVSASTLGRWETGQRHPQTNNLINYHQFLMQLATTKPPTTPNPNE